MSDPLSAPPPLTAAPTVTAAPPTTVVAPPPTTITATPAPIIAESPGANISPLLRLYEQSISAQVSVLATRWSGNDLLIKFSASTSVQPPYPASSFSNERSHRDLERLVAHLLKMYPTNIVPAALLIPGPPSARALDRGFAAALEKVLTRLFAHPIFSADAAMILFFTSPAVFDPPAPSSYPADSPTAVLRVPTPSIGSRLLSLVTSGPKDIDPEFERRKERAAERDFCLKALTRSAEKLAASRRVLASALGDAAIKTAAMAQGESAPVLAGTWTKLGQRLHAAAEIEADHAAVTAIVVGERAASMQRAGANVQVALDHRLTLLEAYDDACRATERHKRKMDKLRAGRPTEAKVQDALIKLDGIKGTENALRFAFRTASDLLARDYMAAEHDRVQDWRETIALVAKGEADAERRLSNDVWGALRVQL